MESMDVRLPLSCKRVVLGKNLHTSFPFCAGSFHLSLGVFSAASRQPRLPGSDSFSIIGGWFRGPLAPPSHRPLPCTPQHKQPRRGVWLSLVGAARQHQQQAASSLLLLLRETERERLRENCFGFLQFIFFMNGIFITFLFIYVIF